MRLNSPMGLAMLTAASKPQSTLILSDDFSAALSAIWTNQVGEFETSGGIARAHALGAGGPNLIYNGEFTTDLTGWSDNGYGGAIYRRDFSSSPDIDPTGGDDEFGLEILHDTANYAMFNHTYPCYIGAYYDFLCRAYAPSTNVSGNPLMRGYPYIDAQNTAVKDAWVTLHTVMPSACDVQPLGQIRLNPEDTNVNDKAYFDKVTVKLMRSISTFDAEAANVKIIIKVTPHATNPAHFGIVARYTDSNNYWLWKIKPNLASGINVTDFSLIEVNGNVETIRDSFYVGFTNTQYTLTLEHYGDKFRAKVDDVIVLQWTDVDSLNTSATLFGLYENAPSNAQFDDLEAYTSLDFTEVESRLFSVGDSRTVGVNDTNPPIEGMNGWPYLLAQSLTTETSVSWYEQRCAVGGYTVAQLRAIIDAELAKANFYADRVCVSAGYNNHEPLPAEATFKADYLYILDACHTKWPNAPVYCDLIPNDTAATINPWIADCYNARDWAYLGIDETQIASIVPTHPEHAGYAEWAAAFLTLFGY